MASQNPQPNTIKIAFYTVKADGSRVGLRAPYHPDAIEALRALGARWNGEAWLADPRDAARLRDIAQAVYGTDGTPCAVVDVRVVLSAARPAMRWDGDNNLFLLGRQIARRAARDYRAMLGDGVAVIAGAFSASGGSRNNPTIGPLDGITVEVRDVPAVLADAAIAAGWAVEVPGSRREPHSQPVPAVDAGTGNVTPDTDPADALLAAARAALAALSPEQRMRLLTEALGDDSN